MLSSGSGSGVLDRSAPRFYAVGTLSLVCPRLPSPLHPGFSRVTERTASLGFASVPLVGVCLAAVKLSGFQTPHGLSLLGGSGAQWAGGAAGLKPRPCRCPRALRPVTALCHHL